MKIAILNKYLNRNKINLHVHSTRSDGDLCAKKLINEAAKEGIRFLSITDHDTITYTPALDKYAKEKGMVLVPGVEITAWQDTHILLYFMRDNDLIDKIEEIEEERLKPIQEARTMRTKSIADIYSEKGTRVNFGDVEKIARDKGSVYVGVSHLAEYLLKEKGYCTSIDVVLKETEKGDFAQVVHTNLPQVNTVLSHMRKDYGLHCFFAHPFKEGKATLNQQQEYITNKKKNYNLDGISVDTGEQLRWAKENGLWVTVGTDYHGKEDGRGSLVSKLNLSGYKKHMTDWLTII